MVVAGTVMIPTLPATTRTRINHRSIVWMKRRKAFLSVRICTPPANNVSSFRMTAANVACSCCLGEARRAVAVAMMSGAAIALEDAKPISTLCFSLYLFLWTILRTRVVVRRRGEICIGRLSVFKDVFSFCQFVKHSK